MRMPVISCFSDSMEKLTTNLSLNIGFSTMPEHIMLFTSQGATEIETDTLPVMKMLSIPRNEIFIIAVKGTGLSATFYLGGGHNIIERAKVGETDTTWKYTFLCCTESEVTVGLGER